MKIKRVVIFLIILVIVGGSIFFIFSNNATKKMKIGNNSSSQEIVNYILNISSYEAIVEVEIKSNKNNNKYILKQQYMRPDTSTQEVIEPSNIAGVRIIKKGNELKIENTNLNLATIFNNYEYISENSLDLNCFIENYKQNEKSEYVEENNELIMKTKVSNLEKKLYIDRTTGLPIKMQIKDNSKKTEIYILYNEVNINSLKEENILAFEKNNSITQIETSLPMANI